MITTRSRRTETLLRLLIALASIAVCALFLITALRRLRYPYELEELEGYMVLSVLRVLHGQSLYPPPSLSFIPYMYPPGYFYVAAALGKWLGVSFFTLRLTSILSTLGCFAAIYLFVWSEVRKHLPAVAAAGLYAGCYPLCSAWFDLGRLDSFFVMLLLVAMFCTRRLHPVIAAVAWTLTFQTKQSILPAAVVMLCFNFRSLKKTLAGLATLLAGAAGTVLWLNHQTQGWYSFYVFQVPRANSDLVLRQALEYWPYDIFRPLALALVMVTAAAFFTRPSFRSPATRFYLASLILFPLFWFVRTHSGATGNTLMPIYALIAVLFGISFSRLYEMLRGQQLHHPRFAVMLLLIACLLQDAAGIYNPGRFTTRVDEAKSLQAVVTEIKGLPGDVYVAQHPYYAVMAGKPPHADLVSIHDAMRPANALVRAELQSEIATALTQHQFSAILLNSEATTQWFPSTIKLDPAWEDSYVVRTQIPCTDPTSSKPSWIIASSLPTRTCATLQMQRPFSSPSAARAEAP